MTVTLTEHKAIHLKGTCLNLLKCDRPKIREVAKVIGLMISSVPAVELSMLYYR